MVEGLIVGAVIVLLIAGFWWTRRAPSYLPGGIDDPARQDLALNALREGDAKLGEPER